MMLGMRFDAQNDAVALQPATVRAAMAYAPIDALDSWAARRSQTPAAPERMPHRRGAWQHESDDQNRNIQHRDVTIAVDHIAAQEVVAG